MECHSEDPTPPAQQLPGVGVSPSPPPSPSEDLPKLYKVFRPQGSSLLWVPGGEGTSSGEFPNRGQNPTPSTPTLGIGSLRHQAPGSPPFIPLASCPGRRLGPHRGAPAGLSLLRALPGRSPSDAHDVLHLGAEGRRGPRLAS